MRLDRGRKVAMTVRALLSALVMVVAVGPAPSEQAASYQEAPMLALQVKTGELPPVDKRLPQDPLVVTALANQDGGDRTYAVFLPAHYLKKFHPGHAQKEEVEKLAQAAGFKTWYEIGTVGLAPMVQGVVVVGTRFRNVPTTLGNDRPLRSPGNARTEQFFLTR
jgi:hypothetical protein